jgi:hypothetical protein
MKFSVFYAIQRFITVFTRAHHLSISWPRWILSPPYHSIFFNHFNIVLLSTLRSSKISLSLRFESQNFICTSLSCVSTPAHLILHNLIILIIFSKECILWETPYCTIFNRLLLLSPLRSKHSPHTMLSNKLAIHILCDAMAYLKFHHLGQFFMEPSDYYDAP